MAFAWKRDKVCSLKVTEQEKAELIAMSNQLRLPLQELLRRGAFKEGRRLLSSRNRKALAHPQSRMTRT